MWGYTCFGKKHSALLPGWPGIKERHIESLHCQKDIEYSCAWNHPGIFIRIHPWLPLNFIQFGHIKNLFIMRMIGSQYWAHALLAKPCTVAQLCLVKERWAFYSFMWTGTLFSSCSTKLSFSPHTHNPALFLYTGCLNEEWMDPRTKPTCPLKKCS